MFLHSRSTHKTEICASYMAPSLKVLIKVFSSFNFVCLCLHLSYISNISLIFNQFEYVLRVLVILIANNYDMKGQACVAKLFQKSCLLCFFPHHGFWLQISTCKSPKKQRKNSGFNRFLGYGLMTANVTKTLKWVRVRVLLNSKLLKALL